MNIRALKLLLVALILNSSIITAQSRREMRQMFYEAETWMLFEEYQDALPIYLKLLELNPDNYNYKYCIGICYLNIPGEKEKSIPYLEDAASHINPDYRDGKFSEREAPHDVLFYLGTAYRISNQFDKAVAKYSLFYEGMDNKLYDSITVKQHINYCLNAKRLMEKPLYLKLENQGEYISSRRSDVNPVVSADEKTILFTRELPFYEGIFYSRKDEDGWTPEKQIQEELLIDDGYTTSMSPDGNELYLYRDDGYDGNIYVSSYSNGRWSPASKLNENINTKYWESHASISADREKLYFTSNRRDSYGGLDIYVSRKDSLGSWGPAVNLGPTINTPFNEETPFIDATGTILFFSSRGHFNMGGYDVFYSTKLDSDRWSTPVNMGYPLNTTDDDLFYSPVSKGYTAYISRFSEDGYGREDIFKVEAFSDEHPRNFTVRGIVRLKDLMSQYEDSVKVSALEKTNLDTLLTIYSDPHTGKYEFEIEHGDYRLIYESEGSGKIEKDVEFDLYHPGDIIDLPMEELSKSDFTAGIALKKLPGSTACLPGDTVVFELELEPKSLLVVEHWNNDSLLNTVNYYINDPYFTYKAKASEGVNNLIFILKDRFSNVSDEDFTFHASEPFKPGRVMPVLEFENIDKQELEAQQATLDSLDAIQGEETESIDRMGQVIHDVSTGDDSRLIKDAIYKTNELQIMHAGEWLQSLYSVAIEDGAEKEMLINLIAAMSADSQDNAEDYISNLARYADPGLKKTLDNIDTGRLKINKPEDVINHLFTNADEPGYKKNEIFTSLSKLINASNKTAEDILSYLSLRKGSKLWALWILLGGIFIILVIFWTRRKKKKEN